MQRGPDMNKCRLVRKRAIIIWFCLFTFALSSCALKGEWHYYTPQELFENKFHVELPSDAKVLQYEWDDEDYIVMGVIEVTEDYARELISALRLGKPYYEDMGGLDYYNISCRKNDVEYMNSFSFGCSWNHITVVNQHNGTMIIYLSRG